MTKINTKEQENEQIAMYRVLKDAYEQKFKVRTILFQILLTHMIQKLGKDTAIFYLMDSMMKIDKENN